MTSHPGLSETVPVSVLKALYSGKPPGPGQTWTTGRPSCGIPNNVPLLHCLPGLQESDLLLTLLSSHLLHSFSVISW